MQNFVEELVAEYYRTKGYLVMTNYWIPFKTLRKRTVKGKRQQYLAQSWTDIDILARNENELILIQVKAIVNRVKVAEGVIQFFNRVADFLDKGNGLDAEADIKWWSNGVKVQRIVVYEWETSAKSYLNRIREAGISVKPFREYYDELTKYVSNKEGVKEENAVLRLMHFIKEQDARDERKKHKEQKALKRKKPVSNK